MPYIAKITETPGAKYHLARTPHGRAACPTKGGTLLTHMTPVADLQVHQLCRRCFTSENLTYAHQSNAARPWLGTDGQQVARLLEQAHALIETPEKAAERLALREELLARRVPAQHTPAETPRRSIKEILDEAHVLALATDPELVAEFAAPAPSLPKRYTGSAFEDELRADLAAYGPRSWEQIHATFGSI